MVAFISKNSWSNPISSISLYLQKQKLHQLAKSQKGYRGLRAKWTLTGVYFMTLWKDEEYLNTFLSSAEVQEVFNERIHKVEVTTLKMSAINFIPWREVVQLMSKNSIRVNNPETLTR
ncbi:MAG: hypothetical protein HWD92_03275 [Flavobacteriia bacterium]|nr:hypothetical protein [Flavobacteriia bacterium]